MKDRTKILVFATLLVAMIFYIGWVFYLSEPKYIDNCYNKLETFDFVSIREDRYFVGDNIANVEVENGIVLQVDSTKAIIKMDGKYSTKYTEVDLKQHNFRIIGKGTLYHKVNNYVGMNVMMITQIFIAILCVIIISILASILKGILD